MKLILMTPTERSLLLYLEACAVDSVGKINGSKMNNEDFTIAARWNNGGFISFGRIPHHDAARTGATHWVRLSDDAWELAHKERRSRSERMSKEFPYEREGITETQRG